MAVTVKIKSGDLNKALKNIRKVKTGINKKTGLIIVKGAFDVDRKAKRIVPVEFSGLKTSIRVLNIRKDKLGASVGSDLDYAPNVEFGKPVGTGPHGGPKPYLKPAFDTVSPKIIKAIRQLLKNA